MNITYIPKKKYIIIIILNRLFLLKKLNYNAYIPEIVLFFKGLC